MVHGLSLQSDFASRIPFCSRTFHVAPNKSFNISSCMVSGTLRLLKCTLNVFLSAAPPQNLSEMRLLVVPLHLFENKKAVLSL